MTEGGLCCKDCGSDCGQWHECTHPIDGHKHLDTAMTCPVCGSELIFMSCKKYCSKRPECGYFESCSEF